MGQAGFNCLILQPTCYKNFTFVGAEEPHCKSFYAYWEKDGLAKIFSYQKLSFAIKIRMVLNKVKKVVLF